MQDPILPNRPCPICSEKQSEIVAELPAHTFVNVTYRKDFGSILSIAPDTRYPLVSCRKCHFVFAGHLPPQPFLQNVYENAIDHSLSRTGNIAERLGLIQCCETILRVCSEVLPSRRPLKLLDYGCGYGDLLRILSMREIDCVGYDPSAERRSQAGQTGYVSANLTDIRDRGPYDAIVCHHVLEHVPLPRDVIQLFTDVANDPCVLSIAVPDVTHLLTAERLAEGIRAGRLHDAINPWEHLNYFSPTSLQNLLRDYGFHYECRLGSASHWFNQRLHGLQRFRNYAGTLYQMWQQRPQSNATNTEGIYLRRTPRSQA